MTCKLSILVPICNVEKYLPQCLESLINQTLKDIEIICINDGSSDSSLNIIKEYANRDTRIVVIDKPNSGYGDSMNVGLARATGEYIGIVESDDFVELDMFENLYQIAVREDINVVRSRYFLHWDDREIEQMYHGKIIYGKVFDPAEEQDIYLFPPAIWSAIYKKSFLLENNIKFLPTPGASYQDTSFFIKTLFATSKLYLVNTCYLHYRQDNPNSSVKATKLEKAMFVNTEYHEALEFCKKNIKKFSQIEVIFNTKMLRVYLWNLYRISLEDKMPYAKASSNDIKKVLKSSKYLRIHFSITEKCILRCIREENYKLLKLIFSLKRIKAQFFENVY